MNKLQTGKVLSVRDEGTLLVLTIADDRGFSVRAAGDHRPTRHALERLAEDGDIVGMHVVYALTGYGALFVLGAADGIAGHPGDGVGDIGLDEEVVERADD